MMPIFVFNHPVPLYKHELELQALAPSTQNGLTFHVSAHVRRCRMVLRVWIQKLQPCAEEDAPTADHRHYY